MEDLSGRLALVSRRTFVSGDGLVNSNHYLHDYLAPGRVADFLRINRIEYLLTSNIQCYPYRKRMPWTRDVDFHDGVYHVTVDTSYLTNLPIKPSVLMFPASALRFDMCVNGIREMLFKITY